MLPSQRNLQETNLPRLFSNNGTLLLLIFLLTSAFYSINLSRPPHPDELYHLLAARGQIDHGEPRIAEGLYLRVFAYTWVVAQLFSLFGESLAIARLPSVTAMAAVVVILFAWLRREVGFFAALFGSGLFAISPFAVEIAQFARFYAWQCLAFLMGSLAAYEIVRQAKPITLRLIFLALLVIFCFAFAIYTQPTTFFGLTGIILWLMAVYMAPWLLDTQIQREKKIRFFIFFSVTFGVLFCLLWAAGTIEEAKDLYRLTPIFNIENKDRFWYYHEYYNLFYPSFWPLIGFLSIAGLALRPNATLFAMTIFVVGFVLNSLAGTKSLRYIVYAQPFLFIIIGIGSAALFPFVRQAYQLFSSMIMVHLEIVGHAASKSVVRLLFLGALLVLFIGNTASVRTVTLLADITVPPEQPNTEWEVARPYVEPFLQSVDVVVTTAELETLYFWDRYDILFSPSRLHELVDEDEFASDFRTGRPVISTRAALESVVSCWETGIFVSPWGRWRERHLIDSDTVAFIEQELERLELPSKLQLVVFTWDNTTREKGKSACIEVTEGG